MKTLYQSKIYKMLLLVQMVILSVQVRAQMSAPDPQGIYGGIVKSIHGYTKTSDTTRLFISTESANSMYYADVYNPMGSSFNFSGFQIVPGLTAGNVHGSGITQVEAHSASGLVFFCTNQGLFQTSPSTSTITTVVSGNVNAFHIEGNTLMYVIANKFHFGTLNSSGAFTAAASSPATMPVSGYPVVIDVNPVSQIVYILFGGYTPTFYKTSQTYSALGAGLSFSSVSLGTLSTYYEITGMGISPSGRIFIGGHDNTTNNTIKVFRYTDDESTWVQSASVISGVGSNTIDFAGTSTSYLTYFAKCYSSNQGTTWTTFGNSGSQTHPNDGAVFVDPNDTLTVYMTSDIGISVSVNGGSVMTDIEDGIEAVQVKDWDMTTDKNTAWGASKSGIRKVTNYTTSPSWSTPMWPNGDGSPYYSADMKPSDPLTAYVANLRIYKTTDGGSNWSRIFSPEDAPYYFIDTPSLTSSIEVCPYDENIVFATWEQQGFYKGGLFYSMDAGSNWSQLKLEVSTIGEDVDATDVVFTIEGTDTVAYVGVRYDLTTPRGRSVYRIVKSGSSWTASQNMNSANTSTGSLIVATIEDLFVSVTGDTLIATGTDAGNNHPICYYKIYSGTNKWTPFTTSGFPFVAGKEGKSSTMGGDTVFCAVDADIYYMRFGGTSWTLGYSYPDGTEINFLFYDELLVGTSTGLYAQVTDPTYVPATGNYRSAGNVNFSSASNWETEYGASWVAASRAPSSSSGTITIRSGHTATLSGTVTLDELTIEAGARFEIQAGATLNLATASTIMDVYGSLSNSGSITGSIPTFKSGSVYEDNHSTSGVSIPSATWDDGSTTKVIGVSNLTSISLASNNFYNFIWNCPSQTSHANALMPASGGLTVRNIFEIRSTGTGSVALMNSSATASNVLSIGDSLVISNGSFNLANGANLSEIALGGSSQSTGNFIMTGGEIIETGSANPVIRFNGTNGVFIKTSGIIMGEIDVVVNDTNLNLSTYEMDGSTGDFTLSASAGLSIAHPQGIQSSGASGSIRFAGAKSFSQTANYRYTGTGSQQTGNALPTQVNKLILQNTGEVTLSSTVQINNYLEVNGTLRTSNFNLSMGPVATAVFNSGATLNIDMMPATVNFNNRPVTLRSDATGTASILEIKGNLQNASNVTVERFIPGSSGRRYRYLAAPFASGPTVSNSWQQQIHITGTGSGGSVCPSLSANSNGFDATLTNQASMHVFAETSAQVSTATPNISGATVYNNAWTSIPSTTGTSLQAGKGYRVFVRGNRSQGCNLLNGTNPLPEDVTLSASGTLQSGPVTIPLTYSPSNGQGWNLVGNPYACSIDWDNAAWTKTNIDNAIWIFNPSTNTFATYNGITGLNGGDNIISSGQAFFVKANAAAPVLMANEAVKVNQNAGNPLFKRTIKTLRAQLLRSGPLADEMTIHIASNATDAKDGFDAEKMFNTGLNLYSMSAGMKLAMNAVAPPQTETIIPLGIQSAELGKHKLLFSQVSEFDAYDVLLEDKYAGTITLLNDKPNYEFEINANAASQGENRFSIIFVNRGDQDYLEKRSKWLSNATETLQIYPNPSKESVHIQLAAKGNYSINILNTFGQILQSNIIQGMDAEINLSNLPAGVYFVQVIENGVELNLKKLVRIN